LDVRYSYYVFSEYKYDTEQLHITSFMDFIQMFIGGGVLDNKIKEMALIGELGSATLRERAADKMPTGIQNQGERYTHTWKLKESVDDCGIVVSQ